MTFARRNDGLPTNWRASKQVDKDDLVDIIYFPKAFGNVPHKGGPSTR